MSGFELFMIVRWRGGRDGGGRGTVENADKLMWSMTYIVRCDRRVQQARSCDWLTMAVAGYIIYIFGMSMILAAKIKTTIPLTV